jgi:hypothetical protein
LDFRDSPRKPYTPSKKNISEKNGSRIIEIPITENPFLKGSPIGSGFLNSYGLDRTLEAIEKVASDYVLFLIHPWECVDLAEHFPNLPENWHNACSSEMDKFAGLIKHLKENHQFALLGRFKELETSKETT